MSGISNIIDMINQKTAEKQQEIIKEAERHKRLKLEEAERVAQDAASKIISRANAEVKSEISKYEAGAKLKSKYRLLDTKENLIKSVLASAEDSLKKLVGKKEYAQVLNRLAIEGGTALEEESLELVLVKGHDKHVDISTIEKEISKQTGNKVKVTIAKENIRATGGVIVRTSDREKWVDNSFEARLERMRADIRDTIASILFEDVAQD